MADNKDRQKQQQVQRQRKMKVLLRPQYSSSLHLRERETRTYRNSEEEEEEEEEESSNNSKSSLSLSKKKQRKLKELSRPGPNGTPLAASSPAVEDQDTFLREKDRQNQSSDVAASVPGSPSELQSATPMPDKKILFSALDKFQKKDTYGVFSEPVDPEELPDYFDIIKNPMDFGTIRSNLERGYYTSLEQLEKDVLLVCSNAMSYNASGTIYYRQARAIQELARKTFQSLRCDPEGSEPERERKSALKAKSVYYSKKPSRRGRWGRSRLESTRTDLASGTSHAISGEHADWSIDATRLRKGAILDKSGTLLEVTGRNLQGHFNADVNSPADLSEEFSGSVLKGTSFRDGRREQLFDENRRATYKPWNVLATGNESLFITLGGDSKQLINSLQTGSEYAYARSLGRFSAELGHAAWTIAAKKIETSLPSNVAFGPGWVGEYEVPYSALLFQEENNEKQTAIPSNAVPTIDEVTKAHSTTSDQPCAKKKDFEGPSYLSSSTMVAPTCVVPVTESAAIPVTQCMGSQVNSDNITKSHTQVVKEIALKSPSPVVESREDDWTGAKFAPDVSQSRLLEIVSRNNKFMQWTSTRQADRLQPVSSLQVSAAERILDATSNHMARESRDEPKLPNSTGSHNVASNTVEPSVPKYEDSGRFAQAPQSSHSQEHVMQDLNQFVNSNQSKVPGLQQIASNMSINTGSHNVASNTVEPSAPKYEDSGRFAQAPQSSRSQEHVMQDLNQFVNSNQSKVPGLQQIASNMSINTGSHNVASNTVEPSAAKYEDSGRFAQAPQSSHSQEHVMQDLNQFVNSNQSKIPGLQQIASNMSINTPIFGFSSAQSRQTTVNRGDAVAEAWARSQAADLVHADASSISKMQVTSDRYYNSQQSQVRPSSSFPQYMQQVQQTPFDMSLYMQLQQSRMHPQSMSKFSHTVSIGNGNQMAVSSNINALNQINYMQTPVRAEVPQSQQCLWQTLPSKHPFQQTSDFLHSIPPDLNVGFQSPKSPGRQSSGVMTDSQPDLALQL